MAAPVKKVFEIYVTRIPWTIATRELTNYFRQFGNVTKCVLPFNLQTGFHRGNGWIKFSDEEGVTNALQKYPHILEGVMLQVQRNNNPFEQKVNKESELD